MCLVASRMRDPVPDSRESEARTETEVAFELVYAAWQAKQITQTDAAKRLGVSPRTFRRWVQRYQSSGLGGLQDRRRRPSPRRASQGEVDSVVMLYETLYLGWNVQHFHEAYRTEHGGTRSYSWVKDQLQAAGLIAKRCHTGGERPAGRNATVSRSSHRVEGSVVYQYSLSHDWIDERPLDLALTVDGGSGRVYSGVLAERATLWSVFRGVRSIVNDQGLFAEIELDGSLLRHPKAEEWAASDPPRWQLRRAMKELGIEVSLRPSLGFWARIGVVVRTLVDRLPKEFAKAKVGDIREGDAFLRDYWPAYNIQFASAPTEQSAFEPLTVRLKEKLHDVLCLKTRTRIGEDGCVRYGGQCLRIRELGHREILERAEIQIHEYQNGLLTIVKDGKHLSMVAPDGRQVSAGP